MAPYSPFTRSAPPAPGPYKVFFAPHERSQALLSPAPQTLQARATKLATFDLELRAICTKWCSRAEAGQDYLRDLEQMHSSLLAFFGMQEGLLDPSHINITVLGPNGRASRTNCIQGPGADAIMALVDKFSDVLETRIKKREMEVEFGEGEAAGEKSSKKGGQRNAAGDAAGRLAREASEDYQKVFRAFDEAIKKINAKE